MLAQEDKFKSYYNQLTHTINMYTHLIYQITADHSPASTSPSSR